MDGRARNNQHSLVLPQAITTQQAAHARQQIISDHAAGTKYFGLRLVDEPHSFHGLLRSVDIERDATAGWRNQNVLLIIGATVALVFRITG